jgi:catechol 2,3-dioxygenase-like lactoylglutathione lyase family enzyme
VESGSAISVTDLHVTRGESEVLHGISCEVGHGGCRRPGNGDTVGAVFDRVTMRVADLEAAERFYRTSLAPLGIEPTRESPAGAEWDDFALAPAGASGPTRNLHVGFVAPSREHVDAFWHAGIAAGYEDDGAPGERPIYTPSYYGAFLRDPDGNSVEAVRHDDVRRGGGVDHLWIGVGDLERSAAFYEALMPRLGLRPGRRWEGGRQFRGAWATFSLLADGRAPTEGLRLAFPAPDQRAVEEFQETASRAGIVEAASPRWDTEHSRYFAGVPDVDGTVVESVFRP